MNNFEKKRILNYLKGTGYAIEQPELFNKLKEFFKNTPTKSTESD